MSIHAVITGLNDERLNVINQIRAIYDAVDARGKNSVLNVDEKATCARLEARCTELEEDIQRRQRLALMETDSRTLVHEATHRPAGAADKRSADKGDALVAKRNQELRALFAGDIRQVVFRALQVDNETQAGGAITAEKFVQELIQARDDALWIRKMATVIPCEDSKSLGVLTLDADPDDGEWTTELKTGGDDEAMSLGKREMEPHRCARRLKISRKMLRLGAWLQMFVQKRLAYKATVVEEKAYISGDGVGKPLGVFTPSPSGISTGRDVVGSNTTTLIKADTIYDMTYSIKDSYLANAVWVFARLAMKQIRQLKSSDNQYLWQPSLVAGQPDTLAGRPIRISEFAPGTVPGDFAAGKYVGLLGDFSYYWIANGLGFELRRADEIYIEKDQVGFFGMFEADGQPVLEEAFARMKLAAS